MEFRGLFSILRIRDSGDAGGELAGVVAGERAAREGGASLHVLVMDMDGIKSLKDKFGQLQRMDGDECAAMLGGRGWGGWRDAAECWATSVENRRNRVGQGSLMRSNREGE